MLDLVNEAVRPDLGSILQSKEIITKWWSFGITLDNDMFWLAFLVRLRFVFGNE